MSVNNRLKKGKQRVRCSMDQNYVLLKNSQIYIYLLISMPHRTVKNCVSYYY